MIGLGSHVVQLRVHKPQAKLSTSLTVITEAKKETVRAPTVVWGPALRSDERGRRGGVLA